MNYLSLIYVNDSFKVLSLVIVLDLIFGILRAIKEKSVNSSIGIDGMIRKVGMLLTIITLIFIDYIIKIDFIGFIPEQIKQALNIERVGIDFVFCIMFIIFEILSIFKNMILCKLPIPKKLQKYLEKLLDEFTNEIPKEKEKEGNEESN